MTTMNNTVTQLLQRVSKITQASAQARQIEQTIRAKSPQELEQFVRNMCAERGTTVEELARSMGLTIPSER